MKTLQRISSLISIAAISVFLTACVDGDTELTNNTPTTPINVTKNVAPTISGTPNTVVNTGSSYIFVPLAYDNNGDTLTFSILNLPSWASFNTTTGSVTGTTTSNDIGSYSNIKITVSDGTDATTLAAFNISVISTNIGSGSAVISWNIPATYEDGSTLNIFQIGGYKIYIGTSANNLYAVADINDPYMTSYTLSNLAKGNYYIAVSTYDTDNIESSIPSPISLTI